MIRQNEGLNTFKLVVANKLDVKFLQVRSPLSNDGHEGGKRVEEWFCDVDFQLRETVIKEAVKNNADIRNDELLLLFKDATAFVILGNTFTSEI